MLEIPAYRRLSQENQLKSGTKLNFMSFSTVWATELDCGAQHVMEGNVLCVYGGNLEMFVCLRQGFLCEALVVLELSP